MKAIVLKSVALCAAALLLPALCRADADCDALLPGGVGLEKELTGLPKSELEGMLAQIQQQQAELTAFRTDANQIIADLGSDKGLDRFLTQNEADMKDLRTKTLEHLEKSLRAKYADQPGQVESKVRQLKTKFDTNAEYRHGIMTNAFQLIHKKIKDGSISADLKQRFEGLCETYPDLNAWESDVEDQRKKLASARAVTNPDCWSALQRKFAVAITRLQTAMNESATLDLGAVKGMLAKIEALDRDAAEAARDTLRYLEVQDTEARGLLLQFEAHMKAMAGKWQAPPADLLKEMKKLADRSNRDTVRHYNTLVKFMEMAEETAAESYWQQQLKDRKPATDLLEDYAQAKRAFSVAQHGGASEDKPQDYVGHDAFRQFATEGEGKNDATGRAVRDLLATP